MAKQKIKNLSGKKKKKQFEKLGISSSYDTMLKQGGLNMKGTIDEIANCESTIICARTVSPCIMKLGGKDIKVLSGTDLVMPMGLYFQSRRNEKTKEEYLKPSARTFKERFRRYRGQNLDNKKLLIWRFGGIGDLMFAQPLIQFLKYTYPTCHITFGTSPNNMSVFDFWPTGLVDHVITMPFQSKELDETDYHLTFEGSIERCREAKTLPAIDVFAKMANLEFNAFDFAPIVLPNKELVFQLRQVIPEKTVALQVRASSMNRSLSTAKVIELINAVTDLGFNVGILDAKKTSEWIDKFIVGTTGYFKHPYRVFNLAKVSESLQHCVAILSVCSGAIATDSSVTHLAAGLEKPIVGIYGPFRGNIRMSYYKTGAWVDTPSDWNECGACPCFYHENELRKCPYLKQNKHVGCLDAINVNEVIEKFVGLYEQFVEKKDES